MLKKTGKHVLILDDVWDDFSLEEVGIPEPSSSNGCNQLACLPLTIAVVAGTLKGEDDPLIWKNAFKELKSRIGMVEGVEAKVIERLKFSFNHLKEDKVRQCFLYCALYPEDFPIQNEELVECWIDEGFIDEMETRKEMEDKGHAILKRLQDNCLLENATSRYNDPHDAVRDMALYITSRNPRYMIQAGLQLKRLPRADVEKVSLMDNSISEIPEDMCPPNCQLLTTLLLQHDYFMKKIPNAFFVNMPCLSVLNLSYTNIESLPDSISGLMNLTALLLNRCGRLRHVPCLSKLQGLKKLDLGWTKIVQVPEGMEMLVNLRYLDLRVMSLKEMPRGLLTRFPHLQHLRFRLENGKTRLKAEEVGPNAFGLSGYWDKTIIINEIESCEENAIDLRLCTIRNCRDMEFGSSTFSLLKVIYVVDCWSMKTLLPNLQNLEQIHVAQCEQLIEILGAKDEENQSDALIKFSLPNLKRLELYTLPQLESICSKRGVLVCDSLQLIHVYDCSKLKRIPPFVPLVGNGQPYAFAPPSLQIPECWWESLEWDDPSFKNVLQPHLIK
ncbi:hypothetical protein GQ457_01G047170 [Hibiscus cannabinus]